MKVASYGFQDLTGSITPAATAEGTTQKVATTVPGQNARYSVTMSAGEKVSLRTNNSKMSAGYRIEWLNPEGKFVYGIGFGKEENWFWDTKTFASAGTYTLLIDPEGTATGSVDVQLWEDPDLTGQTITPSEGGGSVTSTIKVPGQRELVTFSGTKDRGSPGTSPKTRSAPAARSRSSSRVAQNSRAQAAPPQLPARVEGSAVRPLRRPRAGNIAGRPVARLPFGVRAVRRGPGRTGVDVVAAEVQRMLVDEKVSATPLPERRVAPVSQAGTASRSTAEFHSARI